MDGVTRPWDGSDSPIEALYQHFTGRMAAIEAKLGIAPLEAHQNLPMPGVIVDVPGEVPQQMSADEFVQPVTEAPTP